MAPRLSSNLFVLRSGRDDHEGDGRPDALGPHSRARGSTRHGRASACFAYCRL